MTKALVFDSCLQSPACMRYWSCTRTWQHEATTFAKKTKWPYCNPWWSIYSVGAAKQADSSDTRSYSRKMCFSPTAYRNASQIHQLCPKHQSETLPLWRTTLSRQLEHSKPRAQLLLRSWRARQRGIIQPVLYRSATAAPCKASVFHRAPQPYTFPRNTRAALMSQTKALLESLSAVFMDSAPDSVFGPKPCASSCTLTVQCCTKWSSWTLQPCWQPPEMLL